MAYRKRTLRTMSPTARKVARLTGELQSVTTRLKNLVPELQALDLAAKALETAAAAQVRASKLSQERQVVPDPTTGQTQESEELFPD